MSTKVALKGHQHGCPMTTGSVPHVGGKIAEGDASLTVNGIPIALQGHRCTCQTGSGNVIAQGHAALTVNGVPVAVQGSITSHGGIIIDGDLSLTVE